MFKNLVAVSAFMMMQGQAESSQLYLLAEDGQLMNLVQPIVLDYVPQKMGGVSQWKLID